MISLIINSGSSSLKFALINPKKKTHIVKGIFDRIGLKNSFLLIKYNNKETKTPMQIKSHYDCIQKIIDTLKKLNLIKNEKDITFIGHRVVHGGEIYNKAIIIDQKVISDIKHISSLAPLHNPHNLAGILAFKKALPKTPQVAVFDTAFHQTMDKTHYLYGLPLELYKKYKIRKYGFHGTSHKFVSQHATKYIKQPYKKLKIISCHMGNGISLCAIKNGESIDTSMGLTPLEGPMMGTRSGSIDPAIIPYLMDKTHISAKEVDHFLNHECGIKGILKSSSDIRDVWELDKKGDQKARLVLDMLSKQVVGYIGNYTAQLEGLDLLIFTAGIGEGGWYVREDICASFSFMGLELDKVKNRNKEQDIKSPTIISKKGSKVTVIVYPTDEELEIAIQASELL